ncbi:unnamed protein product [Adineta ricciae]|uniref:Peptidase S1 domain-containing protein n=1 Tax=Adineta ricciae TaxID=249248 RepID=A0A814IA32_ADIRI|nr:unnamed protein product [Adineta ricciae]
MNILLLLFLFGNIFSIKAKEFSCNTNRSCGCGKRNVEYGVESKPSSWSMIVSVQYDYSHVCEGSILSDSFILTSANCVRRFLRDVKHRKVSVLVEISEKFQRITIDNIIIHPNWTNSFDRYENDIALLHLSRSLPSTSRSCLSSQNPSVDRSLIIVQWNPNNSHVLRQRFVSFAERNYTNCNNSNQQFCVNLRNVTENTCYGMLTEIISSESRKNIFYSPIFQWFDDHWKQVGISSFPSTSCKINSILSFTRIAHYRQWIEENLKMNNKILRTNENSPTIIYRCGRRGNTCGCGSVNAEFVEENGHQAKPLSWPMIVSIRLNEKHLCSGSILNDSFILTSASCIANISIIGLTIVAGVHNLSSENVGILRKVDRVFVHPGYVGIFNDYINDISILHISKPFDLDDNTLIKQTCLAEKVSPASPSYFYPYANDKLALIGWGTMNCDKKNEDNSLQQIAVYTGRPSNKNCYVLEEHTSAQFCAGLVNQTSVSCVADPGSPIFQWEYDRWVQVGIASYVIDCLPFRNLPLYTRTIEYNEWISSIVNDCPTQPIETTTKLPIRYSCDSTVSCGCSSSPVSLTPARIIGGENAIESSWSMIVSLKLNGDDRHMCGASILSNSYILTAAHCIAHDPPFSSMNLTMVDNATIAVGMTNISDPSQIIRSVDKFYVHPEYIGERDGYRHDIAVLHLNQSLSIGVDNPLLRKTCIHRVDPPLISHEYIKNGTRLSVIGWGTTVPGEDESPIILQQTEVFAMDNDDFVCTDAMDDPHTQFCAGLYEGGKDSCQGDSGGPIFRWTGKYWEQVGIVSHGRGCAVAGSPGIYTRLSYYYDWINDILKTNDEYIEPEIISTNKSSTNIKP